MTLLFFIIMKSEICNWLVYFSICVLLLVQIKNLGLSILFLKYLIDLFIYSIIKPVYSSDFFNNKLFESLLWSENLSLRKCIETELNFLRSFIIGLFRFKNSSLIWNFLFNSSLYRLKYSGFSKLPIT